MAMEQTDAVMDLHAVHVLRAALKQPSCMRRPLLQEADLEDQEEQRRFLSVLSRIKQRDESIYRPDTHLYPDDEDDGQDDDEEADVQPRRSRQQRPARLKDVLARQVGTQLHAWGN